MSKIHLAVKKSYPAKILLYGEQTVLRGGRGLAVPYPRLSLRWQAGQPDKRLLAFANYLAENLPTELFQATEFKDFLQSGQRLTGDIPTGYGLGSSGAVSAAAWDGFATEAGKSLAGENLRQLLAGMERHFHGQSSGTDPLICYLNQPVLLGGGQPPAVTELPDGWNDGFFLLDTGIERSASEYINRFTSRYDADAGFAKAIDTEWTAPANAAIAALIAGDRAALWQHTARLSGFQRREFPDFIPENLHRIWTSEGYVLKLCGAGGGGMVLGLSADRNLTEEGLGEVLWV
jgi:mevalonate kinase